MEDYFAAFDEAVQTYWQDMEKCQQKSKVTDGLLGFGRSIKDDPCHERFDERVEQIVSEVCASAPSPEDAARLARLLLIRNDTASWHVSAQWMLRAVERHALPLIPLLTKEDASSLQKAYAARYKPWERLPVQKEIEKALKAKSRTER